MKITVTHKENMVLEAVNDNGLSLSMDATSEHGGQDKGMLPKELVLSGLAGCTGMDVVSLLKKMRVSYDHFTITVEGQLRDEHPRKFTAIHLTYHFIGKNIDKAKVEKAVNLSQEKYCGVSAMLKDSAKLTYAIEYNT